MTQQQQPQRSKNGVSPLGGAPPMHQEFNKLNTRIRISEERYNDLRQKLTMIEQNMLAQQRKHQNDLRALAADVLSVKRVLEDMKNRILLITKELQLSAPREEVEIIKKYLEYWEPVRFVTMRQVERMIAEALSQRAEPPVRPKE